MYNFGKENMFFRYECVVFLASLVIIKRLVDLNKNCDM